MYDWVIKWAQTPYGPIALFILAFAESAFFPIPPDLLLIALALSSPSKSFHFALNCVPSVQYWTHLLVTD
jgi:membrane protein YqaA with SNARE-associated domain